MRSEIKPIDVAEGGQWEQEAFQITFDEIVSGDGGSSPCRHCSPRETVTKYRPDRSTYTRDEWTCPRVVVALNEGGFNSTGVCLDCILEAAANLP